MPWHVCRECGNDFEKPGRREYRYCGRECYSHVLARQTPPHRRDPQVMIERACEECGSSFTSPASGAGRVHYCSRWCQGQAKAGARAAARQLTVPQAAYLAALIDGEGSVMVQDRRASRPKSSHPTIYLSIAGCHVPMHEWLVATTGVGAVREQTSTFPGRRQNKPCYAWRVTSRSAVDLLRQTAPYMIEKRARAERAIACFERGYSAFDVPTAGESESLSDDPSDVMLSG